MESVREAGSIVFSKRSAVDLIVVVSCYEGEDPAQLFIPKWRAVGEDQMLSLDDIRIQVEMQYKRVVITVIAEYPLRGTIYRYGNYDGADWVKIGTIDGYA